MTDDELLDSGTDRLCDRWAQWRRPGDPADVAWGARSGLTETWANFQALNEALKERAEARASRPAGSAG
jgi:hypothetical protein